MKVREVVTDDKRTLNVSQERFIADGSPDGWLCLLVCIIEFLSFL